MKNFKTYLFDLDGTLLDTNELIFQTFLHTCRNHTGMEITRPEVNRHIGVPLEQQLSYYIGYKTDEEMEAIVKEHHSFQKTIFADTLKVFPGVVEGLKELELKGVKIGIVSSRTRPTLDQYLKHTGIYNYFKVISTPEVTMNHKPHPEPVLWALEQFRSSKEETLFVGDATFDIESGNAAGVATAFVSWSHNNPDELNSDPTFILDDFKQLI